MDYHLAALHPPDHRQAGRATLSQTSSQNQSSAPHVITSTASATRSLSSLVRGRTQEISAQVLEHGAVLFRGFEMEQASQFQDFVGILKAEPMTYIYRSTPRTRVSDDIFTATEYPKSLEIPLHCENAYQRSWPMWVAFCCLTPAAGGGQTPIARMRSVTASLPRGLLDRFAVRGVKYIRHYRPYIDLSWQDVFQTKDRFVVQEYCYRNNINCYWIDDENLRTEQVCQGVASHPQTGDLIFFNQAHLFHPSNLGSEILKDLIEYAGIDKLPRNATYGDDTEIIPADLEVIRAAFRSAAVDIEWAQGDVLLLDNMQFAHGRRAFTGDRRVLASLLNPHSAPASGQLRGV